MQFYGAVCGQHVLLRTAVCTGDELHLTWIEKGCGEGEGAPESVWRVKSTENGPLSSW